MFNVNDVLGAFMQSKAAGSSQKRMEHAVSDRGMGRSGGMLSQLLGNASTTTGSSGAQGLLANLAKTAQDTFTDSSGSGRKSNPVAIGGLGALAGALMSGGRRSAKGALGGGTLALLGSLALDALQNRNQQTQAPTPDPQSTDVSLGLRPPANAAEEKQLESTAKLILKAMINAAKADGEIDAAETQRILGKLQESETDAEGVDYILNEMRQPMDFDGLVRDVPNQQVGAEVYAASLLAIEVNTPAERDYLQRLAQALNLGNDVVQRLHANLGMTQAVPKVG